MRNWKKWLLLITICLIVTNPAVTLVKAEGTVYEKFEKNSPQVNDAPEHTELNDVSVFPYILKLIGTFILIIAILYLIQKYVIKNRSMNQRGGPFHTIGGLPLGSNRSMQLVMVGDTLYILGVGENINLIRMIPPGEEQRDLLRAVAEAETPVDVVTKWGSKILKNTQKEKWKEIFVQQLKEITSKHEKDKDPTGGKGGMD